MEKANRSWWVILFFIVVYFTIFLWKTGAEATRYGNDLVIGKSYKATIYFRQNFNTQNGIAVSPNKYCKKKRRLYIIVYRINFEINDSNDVFCVLFCFCLCFVFVFVLFVLLLVRNLGTISIPFNLKTYSIPFLTDLLYLSSVPCSGS